MFVVLHVESRLHVVDQLGLRNLKIIKKDFSKEHKTRIFSLYLVHFCTLRILLILFWVLQKQSMRLTLAGSKKDSSKFYYNKNLNTCIAVALIQYVGYIIEKAQKSNVNNGLGTSQNKVVTLVG